MCRLTQPAGANLVVARGAVPLIKDNYAYTAQVVMSVDGKVVAEKAVSPGPFEISSPVTSSAGVKSIRLQFFGPIQRLTPPDNRPGSALMSFIGFESPVVASK
jgi:hypothetical protein